MSDLLNTLDLASATSDSLRGHALETAKKFKTSWVDLARVIYTIYKDKTYKVWGYEKFETYVTKEIGIRKLTALKLLRSYGFLEKEEPVYLKPEYEESTETARIPNYEAIDVLRKAKFNKEIDRQDYAKLKEKVFLKGKDAAEVRKDLTTLIRERDELAPEEAWVKRKEMNIKRFVSTLKSLQRDMQETKMVSAPVLREIADLIEKLEIELN